MMYSMCMYTGPFFCSSTTKKIPEVMVSDSIIITIIIIIIIIIRFDDANFADADAYLKRRY